MAESYERIHFPFEGKVVDGLTLAEALDRAVHVYYRAVVGHERDVKQARIRLGEWLVGLQAFVPSRRWRHELSVRGINYKTAENSMKFYQASKAGLVEKAEAELVAAGERVSYTAVRKRLGIGVAPEGQAPTPAHTRDTHPNGSRNIREPNSQKLREELGDCVEVPLSALAGGVEVKLTSGGPLPDGRGSSPTPSPRSTQLLLGDLYAESARLRERSAVVCRMVGEAEQGRALRVAAKVHAAMTLIDEIEAELGAA